ncbi:AAA family ATPase [Candidatus Pacearchaeota archaeon]|jgi:predicted kinase|nr:AAA family ATPase [Candidatus Pacearchaeota archaeon]
MDKKPLIVFCGLMGSGKTTLSDYYSKKIPKYSKIDRDEVRRILGIKVFDRKDSDRVNEYAYSKAREIIKNGKGVMLDSAYYSKQNREKVYKIAKEFDIPVLVIECVCKPETAIRRISSRPEKDELHKPTNNPKVYHEYSKMWESPLIDLGSSENNHVSFIRINTEENKIEKIKIREMGIIKEILNYIEEGMNYFRN